MAGYCGYSMSNNAVLAYEYGEKPFSKWTKSDIINEVENIIADENIEVNFSMEMLKKAPLKTIKELLLSNSSWHHTSSMYNKTEFYSVDDIKLEKLTDEKIKLYTEMNKKEKTEPKTKKDFRYGYVKIQVWGGTRNYRKIIGYEEIFGIVIGGWLHYMDFYKMQKIKIDGNNVVNFSSYDNTKSLFSKNKTDRKEKLKKDIKNIIKTKGL